jgi:nucleotide-binding universal stress UspA family protein
MQSGTVDVSALLVQGTIVSSILKEAERLHSDLVIMGCHKHGRLYGALMDSAEEGMLAKCPCPVMFVPY